ncbi:MAG: penicillin-binding protein 2 [Bacteroidota bacterium]
MNGESPLATRRKAFYFIITAAAVLFVLRLSQLQLLSQEQYGKKSEENSVRPVVKEPIRGYMFDRNRRLIVDSRASYSVTVTPSEFKENVLPLLSTVLDVDSELIKDRIRRGRLYSIFAPARIKRDVDFKTLAFIEENRDRLSGVGYHVETRRSYPTEVQASHLLGYAREISEQQLGKSDGFYKPGDLIGFAGLEAKYETALRGEKGYEFSLVDARGRIIGPLDNGKSDIPSKEGFDLYLSIDKDLQALAEELLSGKRGAIVALDPRNGELLALASGPDYPLSRFSGVTPPDLWDSLNTRDDKPLFNRATMTRYPPGSTFKMVLATAALQEKVIDTNWRITCHGSFRFGNKVFKCHTKTGHGSVNVVEAIAKSCNVFFYNLMLKTGLEFWTKYGALYGFGSPTGIDIGEETTGLLPSEDYFDRVYGKGKWTRGYLVSLAIGQGEIGASPIQMACYAMALANGGTIYQPHAVRAIYNKRAARFDSVAYGSRVLPVSPEVAGLLRQAMYLVVNGLGGTGAAARVPGISVAGKTGTAQNPHGKDHAWFVGFAPFENPQITVCVLVENAGFGGSQAAPLAAKLIEKYLKVEPEGAKTLQANLDDRDKGQVDVAHAQNETR